MQQRVQNSDEDPNTGLIPEVDDYLSEIQICVKNLTSKQRGTSKEDTSSTQVAEGETIRHVQRLHHNFCPCHGSGR